MATAIRNANFSFWKILVLQLLRAADDKDDDVDNDITLVAWLW